MVVGIFQIRLQRLFNRRKICCRVVFCSAEIGGNFSGFVVACRHRRCCCTRFHVAALQRRGKANFKVFLFLFIRIIGLAWVSIVLNVLQRYIYNVLWKNNSFNLIITVDDFCKTWIDSRKACQLARPLDKSDSPKQPDRARPASTKPKSRQSVKKKR